MLLYKSDNEDGTFSNPVLFADYSDPDVIRVGDTYYMTASSFNYVPGLPILISKDLVNWKLVNYATGNIPYENYKVPQHSKGIWAPAIRYHKGEFYIYYGMPDEGIFVVKTKDPFSKWEEPVLVLEGKGLIDPCPQFDEDKAYIVHGYAKSRIGFKSHLGIFEMNLEGTKAISEDHILYNGVATNHTIEGPKVYKRNGYYYIFAPAGGVVTGWQTVLRAKSIYGPFEERIVLAQGSTEINGPHQGALIDTIDGSEWFLHFQDRGLYGRICHVQPVRWENDWPVIGVNADEKGCGEPVIIYKKPVSGEEVTYLEASDEFDGNDLNLCFQWLGNKMDDFYEVKDGRLRLFAKNPSEIEDATLWQQSNVLTEKIVCETFKIDTCMDISSLTKDDQAGMIMIGGHYVAVAVKDKKIVFIESKEDEDKFRFEEESFIDTISEEIHKIYLSQELIKEDKLVFKMSYSFDGINYKYIDTDFMPSDYTWTGAKPGIFCTTKKLSHSDGYVDFSYFRVKNA